MSAAADVLIVGSGPAGVSAAWPLVEAGKTVLMVDAGGAIETPAVSRPPLADVRGHPAQWRHLLGNNLDGMRRPGDVSPKLRTAAPRAFTDGYLDGNALRLDGFVANGALARGGLSNIWGAGVATFDAGDMRGWPIGPADLAPSYRAVAHRIGISGAPDEDDDQSGIGAQLDPPLPPNAAARLLLQRYEDRRNALSIKIRPSRNAIITRPRDHRAACTLDNFCMWGCAKGAIYNAAFDVEALLARPNFTLREGLLARSLMAEGDGWRARLVEHGTGREISLDAPIVVLAAGTLPTTRLVLDALGTFDKAVRVETNPSVAAAFVLPSQIGKPLPRQGYALAQLTVTAPIDHGKDCALATIFPADGVAAADSTDGMPLSRPGAIAATRFLVPAMVIGLLYLPSEYSANLAQLARGGGMSTLRVSGGMRPDSDTTARAALRLVARDFRRLGAYRLPGSTRTYPAGADSHYGGTLRMGEATTADGEVIGARGLFVADGSVFPRLPAKHFTFTVMANADRIGRSLARRLSQ